MIDRKPLTGPSETSHHFIGNHQYAVLVADFAQPFQISIRRNENAVRAGDWFENERSDGLRTLELNRLFNRRQRSLSRFPPTLNPVIRIEHMHHARNARLGSPS